MDKRLRLLNDVWHLLTDREQTHIFQRTITAIALLPYRHRHWEFPEIDLGNPIYLGE